MKTSRALVVALGAACLLGWATVAAAGDHVLCYKVKRQAAGPKIPGFSFMSNTGLAPVAGCTVDTKAKYCCDMVEKSPGPPPFFSLPARYCCYKVKDCANPNTQMSVADQFTAGTRPIVKPAYVCAPQLPPFSPSGAFLD